MRRRCERQLVDYLKILPGIRLDIQTNETETLGRDRWSPEKLSVSYFSDVNAHSYCWNNLLCGTDRVERSVYY
jgi:hypothetical protein